MTKFTKENLFQEGEYLTLSRSRNERKVIARFKYGAKTSIPSFRKFLIDFFQIEEYLDRIADGEMPLHIVQSKGYLTLHIRQWLKRDGFPQTTEGYKLWRAKC